MLWQRLGGRYWGYNWGLARWDEGSLGKTGCRAYWGNSVKSRGGYPSGGGNNVNFTVTVRVREPVASITACGVNKEGPSPREVGPRRFLIFCYMKHTKRSLY